MQTNNVFDIEEYSTDKGLFTIRLGNQKDIENLVKLNSKWCFQDLRDADISNGFLFGMPFTSLEFENIIEHSEIFVAEINNEIGGYYLFDNFSVNQTSLNYETRIAQVINQGLIKNGKICRRAQAVIDDKFQGLGLYSKLFKALNTFCKNKYDKVFSVAHKHNPKLELNYKVGWKIISEDGDYFNVYYEIVR